MLATIIKYLIGGIGVYFVGKLLWHISLKYQASRLNKAAIKALDNQIKNLIKKIDKADVKTAQDLAKITQKKKNLDKLVKLYEEKLENDN